MACLSQATNRSLPEMGRSTNTTAGHRSRGPQDTYPDVSQSVIRRANRTLQRWLDGEIDKMECVTTPSGERIVQSYNRDQE